MADIIKAQPASVVTVTPSSPGLPAVRVFDVASINKHITASLSALEPSERVACVAYADGEGVKVALVGRIDAKIPGELKWTVMATKPYAGSFEWNAGLKWSI